MQRQCLIIPIHAEHEARLVTWVRGLSTRSEEVKRALAGEGMVTEAVFLLPEAAGRSLVVYTAAEDLAQSSQAFLGSVEAVDVEFRELMASCLDLAKARVIEVLFGVP